MCRVVFDPGTRVFEVRRKALQRVVPPALSHRDHGNEARRP